MDSYDEYVEKISNEERMWKAVITQTVEEWVSGPLRSRLEAEEYLFGDGKDFKEVCWSAGLDPDALQIKLKRLRSTGAAPVRAQDARST